MTPAAPMPIEYRLIGPTEGGGVDDLLVGLDQRQGRIRLQALISEWLRMENLVVLTGSGTRSRQAARPWPTWRRTFSQPLKRCPTFRPQSRPSPRSRKNAVAFADILGAPIGFEAWLSFVANALVVTESAGAPFSAVAWPATPAPNTTDLRWFVHRLRIAIGCVAKFPVP